MADLTSYDIFSANDEWGPFCPRCSTNSMWIQHVGYRCPKENFGKKVRAVEFHSNGKVKRIEFVDGGVRYANLNGFIAGLETLTIWPAICDEPLPRIPLSVKPVDVTVTVGGEGQPRFAVEVLDGERASNAT